MKNVMCVVLCVLLYGCALATSPEYSPVIDFEASTRGPERFEEDLAKCKDLAGQRPDAVTSGAVGTVAGAALGAAVGVLTGVIFGDVGAGVAAGALFGGVGGGAQSAGDANLRQKAIVIMCLKNRGYAVVGD